MFTKSGEVKKKVRMKSVKKSLRDITGLKFGSEEESVQKPHENRAWFLIRNNIVFFLNFFMVPICYNIDL